MDGVAQSVEHWTANLATRVRSPVGEEPSDLICAFLHVQMESNWAGLSVCNCRHTGKWCGTIKAVGNTDHTRQTWIHMQTPLSPLAGCGPVGEGTSGKVLNWTVRSLNHAYTTTTRMDGCRFFTINRVIPTSLTGRMPLYTLSLQYYIIRDLMGAVFVYYNTAI